MTDHGISGPEGAIRAFEWADPARRLGPTEPPVDADAYLFELLVADQEAFPIHGSRRRGGRLGPTLVAAVAAVALVGWLVGSLGESGGTRVATDPALAAAETPPGTERIGIPGLGATGSAGADGRRSSAGDDAAAADAAWEAWTALTPWVTGDGTRGRYRSLNFQPEVSFVVPDGWSRPPGAIEVPDGLAPLSRQGRPSAEGLYLAHHKDDDSIAQWLIRMREHPAIAVETVETAELGQVTGMEVRFRVVSPMTWVNLTGEHQRVLAAGQAGVALVADVESRVVSALVVAPSAEELPDVEATARPILDSLRWRSVCNHP